jgi:hypothetical protein
MAIGVKPNELVSVGLYPLFGKHHMTVTQMPVSQIIQIETSDKKWFHNGIYNKKTTENLTLLYKLISRFWWQNMF